MLSDTLTAVTRTESCVRWTYLEVSAAVRVHPHGAEPPARSVLQPKLGACMVTAPRSAARLSADVVPRLRRILFRVQEATHPGDADAPGFRLHPLKGDRAGQWSVRVSGIWRVVFRFEDGEAVDVDLIDYH